MQNRSPQSDYESDEIRSMVSKLSELPQEQIEYFQKSFSTTPTPPPIEHHQQQQSLIDTTNHVPLPPLPTKSTTNNQEEFEIIRLGEKGTKINFKGSLRCPKCVEFDEEECTIWIGYGLHQVALCNSCREHKFAIHLCGANIEFLEKHFFDHPQIVRTRQRINEANGISNRLSRPIQTNTNEQATTSTNSVSRSSSAIPLAQKSTIRKAAIVSRQKTKIMARKPKIRIRSKKAKKAKSIPTNVIIDPPPSNTSTMMLSSQPNSSMTTLPPDNTLSTINLSPPLNHHSPPPFLEPLRIMASTPPPRLSVQTQATGTSSLFTESRLNEFVVMNKSLNERIEDLKQIMEFQNKMMLKGIQRDLSNQTEFLNNFNSQS